MADSTVATATNAKASTHPGAKTCRISRWSHSRDTHPTPRCKTTTPFSLARPHRFTRPFSGETITRHYQEKISGQDRPASLEGHDGRSESVLLSHIRLFKTSSPQNPTMG